MLKLASLFASIVVLLQPSLSLAAEKAGGRRVGGRNATLRLNGDRLAESAMAGRIPPHVPRSDRYVAGFKYTFYYVFDPVKEPERWNNPKDLASRFDFLDESGRVFYVDPTSDGHKDWLMNRALAKVYLMEGTGFIKIAGKRHIINIANGPEVEAAKTMEDKLRVVRWVHWDVNDKTRNAPWGYGAKDSNGNPIPLIPWMSVAGDQQVMTPNQTQLFLPFLRGREVLMPKPGGEAHEKKTLDGLMLDQDTSWSFGGYHLDIFVGTYDAWMDIDEKLNGPFSLENGEASERTNVILNPNGPLKNPSYAVTPVMQFDNQAFYGPYDDSITWDGVYQYEGNQAGAFAKTAIDAASPSPIKGILANPGVDMWKRSRTTGMHDDLLLLRTNGALQLWPASMASPLAQINAGIGSTPVLAMAEAQVESTGGASVITLRRMPGVPSRRFALYATQYVPGVGFSRQKDLTNAPAYSLDPFHPSPNQEDPNWGMARGKWDGVHDMLCVGYRNSWNTTTFVFFILDGNGWLANTPPISRTVDARIWSCEGHNPMASGIGFGANMDTIYFVDEHKRICEYYYFNDSLSTTAFDTWNTHPVTGAREFAPTYWIYAADLNQDGTADLLAVQDRYVDMDGDGDCTRYLTAQGHPIDETVLRRTLYVKYSGIRKDSVHKGDLFYPYFASELPRYPLNVGFTERFVRY